MKFHNNTIRELKKLYSKKKNKIVSRLGEFRKCWTHLNDEGIFTELAFCILTPQSKAKCCWNAIEEIRKHNLLLRGTAGQIRDRLYRVRFHNKKSEFFISARSSFMNDGSISIKPVIRKFSDIQDCREWLVKNIKGLSYKEASHFLRNIGFGDKIAILDRHILKNLHQLGVIESIPDSLSRKRYLQIEQAMAGFAEEINIPLSHLDLLLWYKETGEIFK